MIQKHSTSKFATRFIRIFFSDDKLGLLLHVTIKELIRQKIENRTYED